MASSAQDSLTPCVFLVRHGETEWSKAGRQTGKSDIPLTPEGAAQIASTAKVLIGPGKLLDPSRLAHVFVSPRVRAKETFELLFPPTLSSPSTDSQWGRGEEGGSVTYTEDLTEWDYGEYEGLTGGEVRRLRREKGLDDEREWDILRDGCEGGESLEQVMERIDRLITKIKDIQRPYIKGEKPANALLVSHGLFLRCFIARWPSLPVEFYRKMMLAPGGVVVLSYRHTDIDSPAFYAGLAPTAV
ncbi:putative phosphoglycerate mutase [Chaetomium sp. MPI-SDFR-AT-0129]|nr:putative phosphoglycerate mutase [Chaetomium sp. MPI-SDFR-AT-0129]